MSAYMLLDVDVHIFSLSLDMLVLIILFTLPVVSTVTTGVNSVTVCQHRYQH